MSQEQAIAGHYAHGALIETIRGGLAALGKEPEAATMADLAAIDEFHVGGRPATEAFLDHLLPMGSASRVLDIGCDLGGAARYAASRFGCRVTGIDLTREYVETARELGKWVGLGGRIDFRVGDATDMAFEDDEFDTAYMLHVGMNVPDKAALFAEIARVLKRRGILGIYDAMRVGEGDIAYPVPWASNRETSFIARPEEYRAALEAAGFSVIAETDRRETGIAHYRKLYVRITEGAALPPLGTHILMGEDAIAKMAYMQANLLAGRVAPIEMIARL